MNTDYKDVLQKSGNIEELQQELENKVSSCCNNIFEKKVFQQELANDFYFSYNEHYKEIFETNHLSARIKSLIALAVAAAVHCPYCINTYSVDAFEKGWSEKQIMETMYVVAAVRGGFSKMHAIQRMNKEQDEMVI
ncbi:MAG TPA: carboxymuconolactone decarboxylase family protein [Chitinophagaceae bacterium]|jgi:AhpD family alkylhydroperoxidase